MLTSFVLAAALFSPSQPSQTSQLSQVELFMVQSDLQGLYEEINQTKVQMVSAQDVDALHASFYTTDWTFVDKKGQRHAWTELRQKDIDALQHPPHELLYQPITKMSLSSDGCTATVTTVDGSTTYRDTWVKNGESWKMKTRQEL